MQNTRCGSKSGPAGPHVVDQEDRTPLDPRRSAEPERSPDGLGALAPGNAVERCRPTPAQERLAEFEIESAAESSSDFLGLVVAALEPTDGMKRNRDHEGRRVEAWDRGLDPVRESGS